MSDVFFLYNITVLFCRIRQSNTQTLKTTRCASISHLKGGLCPYATAGINVFYLMQRFFEPPPQHRVMDFHLTPSIHNQTAIYFVTCMNC
jgi:hypothetical protein